MRDDRDDKANPVVTIRPRDEQRPNSRPRRRRPLRAFFRFVVMVGIGVCGTLAWQTYGDMAREMAAAVYPEQLGWLKPFGTPTRSVAATAGAGPTSSAAPLSTPDQQQLAAVSLSLAGIRRRVEELAAQIASNQQQASSTQQQMAAEIVRLQASEQDVLAKLSAPPPRPPRPAVPAHKPAPLALNPAAPAAAAPAAATQ
jgi:uncharacterized coiled-coil protein SlyX